MAYITNYQYYENGGVVPTDLNQGSYQYTSISDIVRNYMMIFVGPENVVDNTSRNKVRFFAKQAVKELNFDALRSIKAVEREIGSTLKMVLPHDYVNYVRLSYITSNGTLVPMVENHSLATVQAYLVDQDNDLTFDGDGEVLYTDGTDINMGGSGTGADNGDCTSYTFGTKASIDPSIINTGPRFHINRSAGVIDFDSSVNATNVVLEYISDGMENGDDSKIMVNKFFEKYVYSYITYEILDSKFGVAAVKVDAARKKKRAEYRNSRIRISGIHPSKLLMRSSN